MTDAKYIELLEHVFANAKAYIEHDFKRIYSPGEMLTYGDDVLVEAFQHAEEERLNRRARERAMWTVDKIDIKTKEDR